MPIEDQVAATLNNVSYKIFQILSKDKSNRLNISTKFKYFFKLI